MSCERRALTVRCACGDQVAYVNMNKLDEELCATMEKLHRSESVASRVMPLCAALGTIAAVP